MTTRAIGALLAALALVCWLATFAPVNLSLAQDSTEAPELEPGRYVVVGVVVYDTWSGHETILRYGWFATPTPSPVVEPPTQPPSDTPQPTPTATLTPSVTPSNTPTATFTATHTRTPVPTPTATPTAAQGTFPTPTPESGGVTPPPTSEYPFKTCALRTTEAGIAVRGGPGTTYTKLASLALGSTIRVERVTAAGGYVWAEHAPGRWSAIYAVASGSWWVEAGSDDAWLCADVPGWAEAGLGDPPGLATALGVWFGPGSNRSVIADTITARQPHGPAAVTIYADCGSMARARDLGALVIARAAVGDNPDYTLTPEASAAQRVRAVMGQLEACEYDYAVLTNEATGWPNMAWLNAWLLAAMDTAAREYPGRRAIPIVWPPGWFGLAGEIDALRPALVQMAARGWPLGLNLYDANTNNPDARLCPLNTWNAYTTYRPLLYRDRLPAGLRLVVTELGAGAGNSKLTPGDVRCFLEKSGGTYYAVTVWLHSGVVLGAWERAHLSAAEAVALAAAH